MDFFGEQQAARRNSRWLVVLFALAVATIIITLYLVLIGLINYSATSRTAQPLLLWQPELFALIALGVSAVILLASLYKVVQLSSGGGAKVAESLGGRLVSRSTNDALERRLLNVVDEMAIASGIPAPKVYILDDEHAINAFAAGTSTNDAVVAVTRGTLEQLNRDELQGVVGHEFSHIFNGDMRLNIRLMGVLHGILFLALIGRVILRGGSRGHRVSSSSSGKKGGGGIVLFALALFVIGYIGVFFGRLIKAAVSRQREFLADASAVQFTRNPSGIAGALKKIAGLDATRIEHPDAESASHMFFGNGVKSFMALLATHPPVDERIRRLDPYFSMEMMQQSPAAATEAGMAATASGFAATGAGNRNVTVEAVRASVGNHDHKHLDYAHHLMERLPEKIWKALRSPKGAHALVLAMVVTRGGVDKKALTILLPSASPELTAETLTLVPLLKATEHGDWLPLLELAIPALEELPAEQLAAVPDEVGLLINADKRVTLFEFSLATVLRHTIGERTPGPRHKHSGGSRQIHQDLGQLLSLMVHAGHTGSREINEAFSLASKVLDGKGDIILLPRSGLSLKQIEASMERLSCLNFRFKGKIIEAATTAIMADGEVKLSELDLLRAIGASLDCPIPPLQVGTAEESGTLAHKAG
jgi:Zn-dependent protease with chaperone function